MPASRWRRLLKPKRKKKNSFKIIIGFFFTPPLFLATKVAISFVYCSPKTIKCTKKPKIEKKFTGIDQSSERASAIPLAHARNSRIKMVISEKLVRKIGASKCLYSDQTCHIEKENKFNMVCDVHLSSGRLKF